MKSFVVMCVCVGLSVGFLGCFPMEAPARWPVYDSVAEAQGVPEALDLDLSGQALTEIPLGIDRVSQIVRLRLRENQFGDLGATVKTLSHVPWIDMGRAGIKSLPPEIAALEALQSWWLSDNALTELPDAIGELNGLQYLNLDRNQLSRLPDAVGQLSAVRWLRLNSNGLTALPDSITELESLERLYLAYNRLASLPDDMGRLARLDTLVLTGNPMEEDELARVRAALPDCNVVFRVREL